MKKFFFGLLLLLPSLIAQGKEATKGVMPELRVDSPNEDENTKKALRSEVLITKSENQAIQSLINILKRQKGSVQEPDLWNRLAELYMRRAKTGRFFDLQRGQENSALRFIPPEISGESAANNLKRAVQIYLKIQKEFPKFKDMDAVLFNGAFASQQLKLPKQAEVMYATLIQKYPKSPLIPDTRLSLGELNYDMQNYNKALEHFLAIEKYPQSKVYSYGLYKSAWTLYNLRQNQPAIDKLIQVVKFHDPRKVTADPASHNLRAEAMRDLALFFGETHKAEYALAFFGELCTEDELGEVFVSMGKLYSSHSRQKEMNTFLEDFLNKKPDSPQRVKAQLLLIDGYEGLKKRKEALQKIQEAAESCDKSSAWRSLYPKFAEEQCDIDFTRVKVEIAKKWWELWQKNKSHKEIADLTRSVFELHLKQEDPLKPDLISHYAYAELLFQLQEYRKSSPEYELVTSKTKDTAIKHDSLYAALVSLEKANAKSKESGDQEKLLELCNKYITQYPQGTHSAQVRFKIGFIAYERQNYEEANRWLKPLAEDPKAGEFKRKSEDLVLDILNAKKDYAGIKSFASHLSQGSKEKDRQTNLNKIVEEADYASVQQFTQAAEKPQAAAKLLSYWKEHKGSSLAKDALWQALSLYYSSGLVIDASDLSLEYAQYFPKDERTLSALKDAAKHYAEHGFIIPAAATMELIIPQVKKSEQKSYQEAAAELYAMENIYNRSRPLYQKLADEEEDKAKKAEYLSRLLETYKNSTEAVKIEEKIIALGQEPYRGQILVRRARSFYDSGKLSDAFNLSMKIYGSQANEEIQAEARVIQAKVLEKEFIETRTKTTVDKLSTVLSIKTEKLDKVQTAYLAATKKSKNADLHREALEGLARCYENYIESVGRPIIKNELQAEEKSALEQELAKLVEPIKEKLQDTEKKIQSLARDSKATGSKANVDFASLPASSTVKPTVTDPSSEQIYAYLPQLKGFESGIPPRYSSSGEKCNLQANLSELALSDLSQLINHCIMNRSYAFAYKAAEQMIRKQPQSPWGIYYLSVISSQLNQGDKALWLSELTLKSDKTNPVFNYQSGISFLRKGERSNANIKFVKAYDYSLPAKELNIIHGLVAYAQGDCYSVVEDFGKLDSRWLTNYKLIPIYSECHAQKGEPDKALAQLKSNMGNAPTVELLLTQAHILETYKMDFTSARQSYEAADKLTQQSDLKEWLARKLNYLKGQTKLTALER